MPSPDIGQNLVSTKNSAVSISLKNFESQWYDLLLVLFVSHTCHRVILIHIAGTHLLLNKVLRSVQQQMLFLTSILLQA